MTDIKQQKKIIVEQFLPAFHYGDAIGNSTLALHEYLLKKGVESRIISLTIDENMEDYAIHYENYVLNENSIKILHFAIPSELTDFFLKVKGIKVMIYHNITPSEFFIDFSDDLVKFTMEGRKHLERLNDCFDLSIAVSNYNAEELRDLNFKNVKKIPLLVDLDEYKQDFNKPFYDLIKDDRKNIIFVGRISPNKKIEDLIKVIFYYKKYISPSIRLIIAGKTNSLPKYFQAVRDLASRFLLTSEDILFTGHIPFDELLSVYKLGDVFLSMSEHEGFCLPLIESSFFGVPVVAYNAGAVSETLKGSGLIFNNKKTELVAGLLENVINNEEIRRKMKKEQEKLIDSYLKEAQPESLYELLENL